MAAGRIQFAGCQQTVGNRNDINRFVAIDKNGDLTKNRPVLRSIKIAGIDQLGDGTSQLSGASKIPPMTERSASTDWGCMRIREISES